jgi:soluble lytic murein transglycosylase
MPPALAAQPEWTYWLGRAYKAGGRTSEADALFEKIAGQAISTATWPTRNSAAPSCRRPRPAPTAEEQKAARDNPGIRRALAFFRLDLRTEAVKEWNWALRGMDDRELLAAANLAKRNQIWDRAINTADRTKNEHDFTLRFLAPYGEQVRPAAQNQSLDDAWVYGLMRQESRFITGAKSNVGASGLMQLMPATAKWVAKKIGLRTSTTAASTTPTPMCCSAPATCAWSWKTSTTTRCWPPPPTTPAPAAPRNGRADQPLEGAIYAETIPF